MLCAYVLEYLGGWEDFLAIADFAYNIHIIHPWGWLLLIYCMADLAEPQLHGVSLKRKLLMVLILFMRWII